MALLNPILFIAIVQVFLGSSCAQTTSEKKREMIWADFLASKLTSIEENVSEFAPDLPRPLHDDKNIRSRQKRNSNNGGTEAPAVVTPATPPSISTSGCRPRKSVEKAAMSTFLSETQFSQAVELCMGMNEQPFTKVRGLMNSLAERARPKNSTLISQKQSGSEDHAKNESARVTLGQKVSLSTDNKQVCLDPHVVLEQDSLYKLFEFREIIDEEEIGFSLSVYLLTGSGGGQDVVSWERLILNNTYGEIATVALSTTKAWRVSGNAEFKFKIMGRDQMSLVMEDTNVTLNRHVTKLSVMYTIGVYASAGIHVEEANVSYGGLLWDFLQKSNDESANNAHTVCPSMKVDREDLKPHTANAFTFTHFFMDLIYDLSKNLPQNHFF